MTYNAKVIAGGIVIPEELLQALGIRDGDSLVLERGENGIVLRTYAEVVREGQRKFRAMVGDDYSVDQFLAERKQDWRD
jgi:bifunctional DNA-binding transcriptional regulator/antitoxin component of YhaV-PrlF toxin-antitoxin module